MIVRCAFCPKWGPYDLPADEAIAKQQAHRKRRHPDKQPRAHRRIRGRTIVTGTDRTLEENIATVRQQGGAKWASKIA
jgi:hypothetical protein